MNDSRQQYLQDKATILAIATIQKSDKPTSDMFGLCAMVRSSMSGEYAATLAFGIEATGGCDIDLFADLEGEPGEWPEADLKFGAMYDGMMQQISDSLNKSIELSKSGAHDGSNVIDFDTARRRRGLLAA